MMTSKPTHTDSDHNVSNCLNSQTSSSEEEVTLTEDILPDVEHLEEEETEKTVTRIELPEPDAENITVLTHKLPNKPILPWNRYDSPWEENESEEAKEPTTEEETSSNEQSLTEEVDEMDEVE